MKFQLQEIRERLQDAIDIKDWWVVKSQINKLDSTIYQLSQGSIIVIPEICYCACKEPVMVSLVYPLPIICTYCKKAIKY